MEKNENEKEQKTLFGDQDFVFNVLDTHVVDINDEISRLLKSKDKIDEKVKKLKEQKLNDLTALDIVKEARKKLKPDEEEEKVEAEIKPPETDKYIGEVEEEEETKEAKVVEEEEEIKLEEDETEEEAEEKEKEESEDPL